MAEVEQEVRVTGILIRFKRELKYVPERFGGEMCEAGLRYIFARHFLVDSRENRRPCSAASTDEQEATPGERPHVRCSMQLYASGISKELDNVGIIWSTI